MFPRPLGRPTLGSMGRVGGDSNRVIQHPFILGLQSSFGPRSYGLNSQSLGDNTAVPFWRAGVVLYPHPFSSFVQTLKHIQKQNKTKTK